MTESALHPSETSLRNKNNLSVTLSPKKRSVLLPIHTCITFLIWNSCHNPNFGITGPFLSHYSTDSVIELNVKLRIHSEGKWTHFRNLSVSHSVVSDSLWPPMDPMEGKWAHFRGAISPLFPSCILDTYWPRGLLFQFHIILPFNAFHGVLLARILKWFAISFSSGLC